MTVEVGDGPVSAEARRSPGRPFGINGPLRKVWLIGPDNITPRHVLDSDVSRALTLWKFRFPHEGEINASGQRVDGREVTARGRMALLRRQIDGGALPAEAIPKGLAGQPLIQVGGAPAVAPIPIKRKRGRPRKNPV